MTLLAKEMDMKAKLQVILRNALVIIAITKWVRYRIPLLALKMRKLRTLMVKNTNMLFKTNAEELRKALKDIEEAEKNGFMFCEAVFDLTQENDTWTIGTYKDLMEKAHPTDGGLNWGRGQDVTKKNRFIDGKVVPTNEEKNRRDNYPASEAIEEGEIDGYKYYITGGAILEMSGLNGYVVFPERPLIERGYGGIATYVPVHGGITYAEQKHFGMVYGFDTAHHDSEKFPRNDKEWIKKQIKKMITGILKSKEIEEGYLTAKEPEAKANYAQQVLDTDTEKESDLNFGTMINIMSGNL